MYEDGIEYCNKALEIDPDNIKAKLGKAYSYAYLFMFQQSIDIFNSFNYHKGIKFVK